MKAERWSRGPSEFPFFYPSVGRGLAHVGWLRKRWEVCPIWGRAAGAAQGTLERDFPATETYDLLNVRTASRKHPHQKNIRVSTTSATRSASPFRLHLRLGLTPSSGVGRGGGEGGRGGSPFVEPERRSTGSAGGAFFLGVLDCASVSAGAIGRCASWNSQRTQRFATAATTTLRGLPRSCMS